MRKNNKIVVGFDSLPLERDQQYGPTDITKANEIILNRDIAFLSFLERIIRLTISTQSHTVIRLEELMKSQGSDHEVNNVIRCAIQLIDQGYYDFSVILNQIAELDRLNLHDRKVKDLIRICRGFQFDVPNLEYINSIIQENRSRLRIQSTESLKDILRGDLAELTES